MPNQDDSSYLFLVSRFQELFGREAGWFEIFQRVPLGKRLCLDVSCPDVRMSVNVWVLRRILGHSILSDTTRRHHASRRGSHSQGITTRES